MDCRLSTRPCPAAKRPAHSAARPTTTAPGPACWPAPPERSGNVCASCRHRLIAQTRHRLLTHRPVQRRRQQAEDNGDLPDQVIATGAVKQVTAQPAAEKGPQLVEQE